MIVAEALAERHDPLAASLDPGPDQPFAAVRAALVTALLPPEAPDPPPGWLRPGQVRSFRRGLAALRAHQGALLADPVGSGKTWVALAVAQALGGPVVALVPAVLRAQWQAAAARAGVALRVHSHQAASRGRLPHDPARLIIIDESHHFREPAARRYHTVAPWLTGRHVLLLSATPVVNRLSDLLHQLLLAVRDDALRTGGCGSLRAALARGEAPDALGAVVVSGMEPAGLPRLTRHRIRWTLAPADAALLAGVEGLALSRRAPVRALLRATLLGALASSPRALAATLTRYRQLLAQAGDARAAGRHPGRAALRDAAGADADQLVLWSLLTETEDAPELVLEDAGPALLLAEQARAREAAPDPRLAALRGLLADGAPTLVFTGSRATLAWLRDHLAAWRPAWLSGAGAGIGPLRSSRAAVLARLHPGAASPPPALLLATDVAAEGLDLQRARRVVHLDLPWTAVRLAQRLGRVRRLGSAHPAVEAVTLLPPTGIERRQRRLERLVTKHRLPARAGLADRVPWQWRAALADLAEGERRAGVASAQGAADGWLLAWRLASPAGPPAPARLLWISDAGPPSDSAAELVPVLRGLRPAGEAPLGATLRARFAGEVAPVLRRALAEQAGEAGGAPPPRDQQRLRRRLFRLGAAAARRRDRDALALADRGLRWLEGGLRAGELQLAGEWLALPAATLLRRLAALPPPGPRPAPALPVIAGIVRVTSFRG